ncbi:MAG: nickel pincer cofactor biosynthesis protein LarB [Thermomicrobiales bacterium]|nr:nickel pincer cofactor biosynthesis protein LarB [Thermomicrobiales bacterium]
MTDPRRSPFDDLRAALDAAGRDSNRRVSDAATVRSDPGRQRRAGIPEVVHAERKHAVDVAAALRRLAEANGRALASRVPAGEAEAIRLLLEPDLLVEEHTRARSLVVAIPGRERPSSGGVVGVLSAGTSDIPIAAEATLMAAEMGADVLEAWDVGVAGLHRLVEPLERFASAGVDVIIVAAGMDGALPSVVAGLVDVPVIGLPTSVGYGFGAGGVGAMTTMLQSCAPGLVVVNIDNGIGAGSTAALIANRAGALRGRG